MAGDKDHSSFVPGMVVGACLGAAVGLLLAPRPGSETVALLLDQSASLRERAAEFIEDARSMLQVAARKADANSFSA